MTDTWWWYIDIYGACLFINVLFVVILLIKVFVLKHFFNVVVMTIGIRTSMDDDGLFVLYFTHWKRLVFDRVTILWWWSDPRFGGFDDVWWFGSNCVMADCAVIDVDVLSVDIYCGQHCVFMAVLILFVAVVLMLVCNDANALFGDVRYCLLAWW